MRKEKRIEILKKILTTSSYDEEQKLLVGFPGVDITKDLPYDNSLRLTIHDMDNDDLKDFNKICVGLPYERGTRSYYIRKDDIDRLVEQLAMAGFVVSKRPGV